jgi:4-hydroxy-tetrahydrodipicolinate reductase
LIEFGAGAELTLGQYLFNKHMIFPKRGVELSDPANFASIRNDRHGDAALAAIAGLLAAPSGLMTSADLPLRGFAGRFRP